VAFGLIGFLPVGRVDPAPDTPVRRVDERDIMFARARLEPGSDYFRAYYAMRPEHREPDDVTRKLPGLLSPHARFAAPLPFASAAGSFTLTEALRDAVDGPLGAPGPHPEPEAMTAWVKGLARYFGARDAGVARLEPHHVYSHVGRGTGSWGEAIPVSHRFAVAFTVEMAHEMILAGPAAAALMESARQYVESARVAVPLAAAIRALGHPARAHIDGNYRVIAPLVARDAGLGEIGRMGLLMTPRLGPRVRLGVVTTDLPLVPDGRAPDRSVLDFCRVCRKCAVNCPSRAIPFEDRVEIDGAWRWRIDSDRCFRYWNAVGTDCGRCMAVCPYSHADNLAHNLMRLALPHSGALRRLAVRADDLLYGRAPRPGRPPQWAHDSKAPVEDKRSGLS
jgi:ferredoxin